MPAASGVQGQVRGLPPGARRAGGTPPPPPQRAWSRPGLSLGGGLTRMKGSGPGRQRPRRQRVENRARLSLPRGFDMQERGSALEALLRRRTERPRKRFDIQERSVFEFEALQSLGLSLGPGGSRAGASRRRRGGRGRRFVLGRRRAEVARGAAARRNGRGQRRAGPIVWRRGAATGRPVHAQA